MSFRDNNSRSHNNNNTEQKINWNELENNNVGKTDIILKIFLCMFEHIEEIGGICWAIRIVHTHYILLSSFMKTIKKTVTENYPQHCLAHSRIFQLSLSNKLTISYYSLTPSLPSRLSNCSIDPPPPPSKPQLTHID